MSKYFYDAFDNEDIDHAQYIKRSNFYEGVQHYLKSVTMKDGYRVMLETPDPLKARKFSLRDIIQMAHKEVIGNYEGKPLKYTTDLDKHLIEEFLQAVSDNYVYIEFPRLEASYWTNSNKLAAKTCMLQELKRTGVVLVDPPKEEKDEKI